MKKLLSIFIATILFSTVTISCAKKDNGTQNEIKSGKVDSKSDKKIEISILMGKPEIGSQFENMLSFYNSKNPNVNITMIPLAGQDAFAKMTSLYASGNAPSISMVGQEFSVFQDKYLDITETEFIQNAIKGTTEFVTIENKVYGAPVTMEAFGIIYSKDFIQKNLGEQYDISKIETTTELEQLFIDLNKINIEAFTLSTMDWSLGAHLTNILFTAQSDNHEERIEFMSDLKKGDINLIENKVFNGWVNTLDLLIKYNNNNKAPLSVLYEDSSMALALGEVATWFMGSWVYPELRDIEDSQYEFMALPISNNNEDYGNGKVSIGVPSYWCVDKSTNNDEQQKASLDFLQWLLNDPEGQNYYVNELNFIPVYNNITEEPKDSMSKQIMKLLKEGNSLELMNSYYPAGVFQKMGASMQKYIVGIIDRNTLAVEFEEIWLNVKM
jgi:raffinose/stachyose/melibiose transport system substrate-binding protein